MSGLLYYDRVQESSATVGTASYALDGALVGYQSFDIVGAGNSCAYCAVDVNTQGAPIGGWEVGTGTLGARTLSRDSVYSSSNGNAKVSWMAGTRRIFMTQPAQEMSAAYRWIDVPFDAANFSAGNGTAVWTVNPSALVNNRYLVVGGVMFWEIYCGWNAGDNNLSDNSATQLNVTIPGGGAYTPIDGARAPGLLTGITGGVNFDPYPIGSASDKAIHILRLNLQAFTAGPIGFFGMFTIAIQR